VQKDRDEYKKTGDELRKAYDELQKEKDIAVVELDKKKVQLYWMQVRHKREIDSLLNVNIPDDTVYVRTGLIFPNYDGGELKYPYSGSQVRQIYAIGITYPRIQKEYTLQTGLLNSCYDLNSKYKAAENNLLAQIGNLNKNIAAADRQIEIQGKEINILNKKVRSKGLWNLIWKGSLIGIGAYAILK